MGEMISTVWDEHRLGWLGLAWFEGFGARTLRKLRSRYHEDGERAFGISRMELLSLGITEAVVDRFIHWRGLVEIPMLARRCDAEAIRFILDDDPEFPAYLKHSSDPPATLFLRGALLAPSKPIAVVGTRAITSYGTRVTEDICRELAEAGCEIVSGLALGVDAKAHDAALSANGITIAVLAGGNNDAAIYPRTNVPLAKRILENNGTLMTEFPPGTEGLKHHFPLRNRLIASLCQATVIIEAAEASGSLITAKLALEENRDVFVVPGPITSEQSAGTNRLLKFGAIPCLGASDILELFDVTPQLSQNSLIINDEERTLLETLDRPLHIDDLIRALEILPSLISSQLSLLELRGLVEHQGGGVYARTRLGKRSVTKPDPEEPETLSSGHEPTE